jgi:hypothetical protein
MPKKNSNIQKGHLTSVHSYENSMNVSNVVTEGAESEAEAEAREMIEGKDMGIGTTSIFNEKEEIELANEIEKLVIESMDEIERFNLNP